MRIISLVLIGIITFVIVLMIKRPELLKDFWLWVIGFAGVIVQGLKVLWAHLTDLFSQTKHSLLEKTKTTTKAPVKKV